MFSRAGEDSKKGVEMNLFDPGRVGFEVVVFDVLQYSSGDCLVGLAFDL